MTQDEVIALLDTLMVAVNKLVDAKIGKAVKSEICIVRYVEDYNVYIRQSSNVNAPTYANPSSTAQLDDGDMHLPNISGHILVAGDGVEVAYTTTIEDGVIVRKLVYAPVVPGGGGGDVDPSDAMPQMDGTGPDGGGSAGIASTYARGDHIHPKDTTKANLASPTFTGTPKAPTASAGTNTTQIATTAFVQAALSGASTVSPYDSSPSMNGTASPGSSTLYSRGDHVHPTDTSRAPVNSPSFTGTPTSPTPSSGDNTTKIATTAFVNTALSGKQDTLTFDDEPTENSNNPVKSGGILSYVDAAIQEAASDITGLIPNAATTNPVMDGTAAVGSSTNYAKADHVHPSDTSRAEASHSHGNITNSGALQSIDIAIQTGDRLVVTDYNNAAKVARSSIMFDAATETKALSPKGTWVDLVPFNSPAFTGTPTAPTPSSGDNTTKIATTAFVQAALSGIPTNELFMGSITGSQSIIAINRLASLTPGCYWYIGTAGTYYGIVCEVGDFIYVVASNPVKESGAWVNSNFSAVQCNLSPISDAQIDAIAIL